MLKLLRVSLRHFGRVAVAASLGVVFDSSAEQAYPFKPVTIIVAAAPGGSSDITARVLAEGLQARWKRPVIVENRGGANGLLAAQVLRKSAPDGYTLMLGSVGQMMLNPLQYGEQYEPTRAYSLIGQVSRTYMVMVTAASAPYNTLDEFAVYARRNPGKASFSSSGVGSLMHIAGEVVKHQSGTDIAHIPYKGEAPALADLTAGTVSAGFVVAATAVPMVRSGALKALAISDTQRAAALPNVPTAIDQGFDIAMPVWNGIVGPPKMSPSLIAQVNRDMNEVLSGKETKSRFEQLGISPAPSKSEEFVMFVSDQSAKWKRSIEKSHIEIK